MPKVWPNTTIVKTDFSLPLVLLYKHYKHAIVFDRLLFTLIDSFSIDLWYK